MVLQPKKYFDERTSHAKNKYADHDMNVWQAEAIYAHVFSVKGATLSVTVAFIDEVQMREKRKAMKENINDARNIRNATQKEVQFRIEEGLGNVKRAVASENEMIRELRLKKYRREKANVDVNFVQVNAQQCDDYEDMIAAQRKEKMKLL